MNKTIKELWIKALRSGEYTQNQCGLKSTMFGTRYCCLGVLCDIMAKRGKGNWTPDNAFNYRGQMLCGTLPSPLRIALGISGENQSYLWRANDAGNQSFAQIANWIEENL